MSKRRFEINAYLFIIHVEKMLRLDTYVAY